MKYSIQFGCRFYFWTCLGSLSNEDSTVMTLPFDILIKTRQLPVLFSTVTASVYPLLWYNNDNRNFVMKELLFSFVVFVCIACIQNFCLMKYFSPFWPLRRLLKSWICIYFTFLLNASVHVFPWLRFPFTLTRWSL